ncbi:protein of unknown function [Xenorhabdus poinarii G6]|uniref:Uncharacterized protein n=1 Tax=Xenorhabdus poinarii G6 TaxID=1354304 RepID=A0A068R4J1_9GAMM|nr:protein of unknown function [Xenorhabdus poinarii G6]
MSSRQVCVFVVTTDAHYREFYDCGNRFFKKKPQPLIYPSKHYNLMLL